MSMRNREFEVHKDFVVRFAELLEENDLDNTIIDAGEDDCIIVQVEFDREDREIIQDISDELNEWEEENL